MFISKRMDCNNPDIQKINPLLDLMKGIKREERKVECRSTLAPAFKGKLISSFEDITDRAYIVKKLPKGNIPQGMWMSYMVLHRIQ